jgi:hypothetical protein
MSAFERISRLIQSMSAFGGKADIANFKIYGGGNSDGCLDIRSAASRRPWRSDSELKRCVPRTAVGGVRCPARPKRAPKAPVEARKLPSTCCVVCGQNERHFSNSLEDRDISLYFGGPWLHQVPISSPSLPLVRYRTKRK